MKKPNVHQVAWQQRHSRRMLERALAWRRWRREKRGGRALKKITLYRGNKESVAYAQSSYSAPKQLCLDRNYEETVKFIYTVREKLHDWYAKQTGKKSKHRFISEYANYSTMKDISPTAALVLAAEFDRFRENTSLKLSTVNEHLWSPNVRFVLRSLGYYELLDMKPRSEIRTDVGPLRILKFQSGSLAVGESAAAIQDALASLLPDDDAQTLLYIEPYSGMFEAILNARNWAYPPDHDWAYPNVGKWWMTGYVDLASNFVTVAVYDQGVSIPYNLPYWENADKLEKLLARVISLRKLGMGGSDKRIDGLAIRVAMKVAKTSTGLVQHGKGLHSMQEVAERSSFGRLRVLSRHGEYVWETGAKPVTNYKEVPLEGTLIEWNLGL